MYLQVMDNKSYTSARMSNDSANIIIHILLSLSTI
jgi:hypothetical protein